MTTTQTITLKKNNTDILNMINIHEQIDKGVFIKQWHTGKTVK